MLKPWIYTENSNSNYTMFILQCFSLSIFVTPFSKMKNLIPIILNTITYLFSIPICDQSPLPLLHLSIFSCSPHPRRISISPHLNSVLGCHRYSIYGQFPHSSHALPLCAKPTIMCGLQFYSSQPMLSHWLSLWVDTFLSPTYQNASHKHIFIVIRIINTQVKISM